MMQGYLLDANIVEFWAPMIRRSTCVLWQVINWTLI